MKSKILVVSHNPFSSTANNGKTLEAIFGGYGSGELCQLFFSEMTPDMEYCQNYFRLTDKDVIRNTFSLSGNSFSTSFSKERKVVMGKNCKRYRLKRFVQDVPFLRDFLWSVGKWDIKPLFEWIENNKPELVFFVGGNNGFAHMVARKLAKRYEIPLVVYFTDDYLLSPISRNWIDSIQRKRMERFYGKTIQQARLCFAIGEKMAQTYTGYFEKPFCPIMNMVPVERMLPKREHENVVISYFGGLHLGRWRAIVKLGSVLRRLQERHAIDLEFNVYAQECPPDVLSLFEEQGVAYKGFVKSDVIKEEFAKSDILLHVESSDAYYRSLTKLSVSTKIPEYLSTGRCVLGFGPKEVASMELLSENQVGIVVSDDESEERMMQDLNQLICCKELRDRLARNAFEYAKEKFNPEVVRRDFMEKLSAL